MPRRIPSRFASSRLPAFSLVEILVVGAIIGLLLGLLLPAVQSARESSRRSQCATNLRSAALAVRSYEQRFSRFPPASTVDPEPRHGLMPFILDGIGHVESREAYRFDVAWNDKLNETATSDHLPELVCPTTPESRSRITDYVPAPALSSTLYQPLIGKGLAAPRRSWTSMLQPHSRIVRSASVKDGLSRSFMLFEAAGRPAQYKGRERVNGTHGGAHWASDGSSTSVRRVCNDDQLANCENIQGIYSFHPDGCNYAYGDAAVRFVEEAVSPNVWISQFTMAAGD